MKSLKEINLLGIPVYADRIPPELSPDIKLSLSGNLTVIPDHTPLFYEDYVSVYHKIVKMSYEFSKRACREGLLSLEEDWEEALTTLLEKIAKLATPAPKAGDTEIFRFIKRAVMMKKTAQREGLLALEKKVIREKGCLDIFEYGISLLVDQYDYKFIEKILNNLVNHETEPAMKTLALIKKEAVLSIAVWDNPRILVMKLVSFFKDNFDGLDEIL